MATLSIEINGSVATESSSGDGQYGCLCTGVVTNKGTLERTFRDTGQLCGNNFPEDGRWFGRQYYLELR